MNTGNKIVIAKRILLFCSVFLILGILVAFCCISSDILTLILLSLAVCALVVYFIISKKFTILICTVVFLLLGVGGFLLRYFSFVNNEIDDVCDITGVVIRDVTIVTTNSLLLENCTIKNDTILLNGKKMYVTLFLSGGSLKNYKAGDKISFTAKISTLSFFDYGRKVSSSVIKGVNYTAALSVNEVTVVGYDKSFKTSFLNNIWEILQQNMGTDNASVAYAMLFGDKYFVSDDILQSFSGAGLSHVLAVSGLHISILFVAIMALFNKFNMNKVVKYGIISAILIGYCYLCSFSPSAVRACILSIVMMLSMIKGDKYDLLNALGFAALIILLLNPLNLFNLGFLLSFSCVFAIALLNSKFKEKIDFKRLNKIRDLLIITLCSTIGILPFIIIYFGYIPLISLLANIVLLPFFSVLYVCLFVSAIFKFIGLSFLIKLVSQGMSFFIDITKYLANLEIGVDVRFILPLAFLIIYFALLFILSNKFMSSSNVKTIVSCCLIIVMCFTISFTSLSKCNEVLVVHSYQDKTSYIIRDKGIIVGIDTSQNGVNQLDKVLSANGVIKLNYVVLCEEYVYSTYFVDFLTSYKVDTLYIADNIFDNVSADQSTFESEGILLKSFEDTLVLGVEIIHNEVTNSVTCFTLNYNGKIFAHLVNDLSNSEREYVLALNPDYYNEDGCTYVKHQESYEKQISKYVYDVIKI